MQSKKSSEIQNNDTGEFLPDNVSRCDRENSCGYQYTPKQYLNDVGLGYTPLIQSKAREALAPEIIDYMPLEFIEKSMIGFDESNFAVWLITLFGFEIAKKALLKYFVGRSKKHGGKDCIFWQIDIDGKIRTGKIMNYNSISGKRIKEIDLPVDWVHKQKGHNNEYLFNKNYNLKQCFFGEHLIAEHPDKTIGITEAEKTAIIASIFMPDMIWIATGAAIGGPKWREWSVFNVLKDRNVILFPDFGYAEKNTEKTCFMEWTDRANVIQERMKCKIKVSTILEDMLPKSERVNDYDLADMLIKQSDGKGPALIDISGYPATFDFFKLDEMELKEIKNKYNNEFHTV